MRGNLFWKILRHGRCSAIKVTAILCIAFLQFVISASVFCNLLRHWTTGLCSWHFMTVLLPETIATKRQLLLKVYRHQKTMATKKHWLSKEYQYETTNHIQRQSLANDHCYLLKIERAQLDSFWPDLCINCLNMYIIVMIIEIFREKHLNSQTLHMLLRFPFLLFIIFHKLEGGYKSNFNLL